MADNGAAREKPQETANPQTAEDLAIQVTRVPAPEKAYGFGTLVEMLAGEILPPQKGHYFVAVRALLAA
jgi:hypothetical protein